MKQDIKANAMLEYFRLLQNLCHLLNLQLGKREQEKCMPYKWHIFIYKVY